MVESRETYKQRVFSTCYSLVFENTVGAAGLKGFVVPE
jgi:hypothetical protein